MKKENNGNAKRLFERLTKEVPVNYPLMEESTAKAFLVPIQSDFHQDKMYHSFSFYKPISKYKKTK